jgi:hypothetical protein
MSQDEVANAAYRAIEGDSSLQGRWVGIANGKVVATSDSEESLIGLMRQAYSRSPFKHGIIAQVGKPREEREWLAGSLYRQE